MAYSRERASRYELELEIDQEPDRALRLVLCLIEHLDLEIDRLLDGGGNLLSYEFRKTPRDY